MATNSISKAIFATVVDNKAIVIAGINDRTGIRLLGATVSANVQQTAEYKSEKSVILYPNAGEDGIVALSISVFDGFESGGKYNHERRHDLLTFLRISWENTGGVHKPRIDLEEPWFPTERIGILTGSAYSHCIEVVVKGKRVSSKDSSKPSDAGKGVIACNLDGNLLCRYLWGTAPAHEVLHAAVQQKLEPTSVERVEYLTREVRVLRNENNAITRAVVATDRLIWEATGREKLFHLILVRCLPLYRLLKKIPGRFRPAAAAKFMAAMESFNEYIDLQI